MVARAALLALAICAPTQELQSYSSLDDLATLSEEQLVGRVREEKNRVDRDVFKELGARGTLASFEALKDCTQIVSSKWPLRFSYEALGSYKDSEELSEVAMEFLERAACGSEPMRSSAAAYGLSLYGEAAAASLRKVVKSSKDPETRSTALAPLLADMAKSGDKADFKTTCENLVLTYRVYRPLGVDTFKTFLSAGGLDLFRRKLSDKKLSAEVRCMMVTALEECADDDTNEVLAEGLKAKDPRVLYETLRALSRRGATLHRAGAQRLTKHKDDAVRHEALVTLARLSTEDPKFIEASIKLARDKDPVERGAAAISLGVLRTTEALEAMHGLLEDESYTVRIEAIIGASLARHESSIPALISRLDLTSGAERDRVHQELCLLTAEDHGKSSKRWAQWWRDAGAAFEVPSLEEAQDELAARQERREESATQSSFYGLNITSERVCFVLDLSGSMNFRSRGGQTRLQILKEEMDRFLDAYPSGHLFNMIFFGNEAERWKESLTVMSDKVRTAAKQHVRGLEAPGATAVYDGLYAAFEDPMVDTIYLLTDGGPSGGKIDDRDEIVMEVKRWNSLRHIVIHTVAVGRESLLLESLSAATNGEHIVVE